MNANGQGSITSGSYDLINYTGSLFGSASTAFGAGSGAKQFTFTTVAGTPNELIANVVISSFAWTGLTGGSPDPNWTTSPASTNWANTTSGNAAYAVLRPGDCYIRRYQPHYRTCDFDYRRQFGCERRANLDHVQQQCCELQHHRLGRHYGSDGHCP